MTSAQMLSATQPHNLEIGSLLNQEVKADAATGTSGTLQGTTYSSSL